MLTLTAEQVKDSRIELGNAIAKFPTPSLLQLAGMLNLYAYCAARHYSAADKVDGKLVIDKGAFDNMLAVSMAGELELTVTTLYTRKYLERYWVGACNGCPSIRRMREFMRDDLGLFTFVKGEKGKTTLPPVMQKVNFHRILLAYEAVEHALYMRGKMPDGYEPGTKDELLQRSIARDVMSISTDSKLNEYFFPKHLGVNMILLFNHCFEGVAVFRRLDDAVALKPNCLETAWNRQMNKRPANLGGRTWKDIARNKKWNRQTQQWERAFASVEEFNQYAERRRKKGKAVCT